MSTTHGTTWLDRTSGPTRHVASFIWKYWDAFQERRASRQGIDPRGIRSWEWLRYLPTVDGQMGPIDFR